MILNRTLMMEVLTRSVLRHIVHHHHRIFVLSSLEATVQRRIRQIVVNRRLVYAHVSQSAITISHYNIRTYVIQAQQQI